MKYAKFLACFVACFIIIGLNSASVFAESKWLQRPDWATGYDLPSYYDYEEGGDIIADDFQCLDGQSITDIHWWGSYLGDTSADVQLGSPSPATDFWIAFWTDIPAVGDEFSRPGEFLKAYNTEGIIGIKDGYQQQAQHNGYKFFFDISDDPFLQEKDTIYWISIMAMDPNPGEEGDSEEMWGWKTARTDDQWNDYAVIADLGSGIDEPEPEDPWSEIGSNTIPVNADMAFELTTTPIPER